MSLCPHFLPEYFCKVHEVLIAFHPQISQTPIHEISSRLVARNVITENEYYDILLLNTNCTKSEKLINIISKRLRGFECFVLILMEENYHSWLSEELFNAYIRHVVEHIKRFKNSKKCTCPAASESEWNLLATVKNKLVNAAEAVDQCLYNVGTSMGFMDQTIFPTKNFLEPINKRLPFLPRGGTSSDTNTQKTLDHQSKNECMTISPSENKSVASITVVNICKVEEVDNLHCAIGANNDAFEILEENERTSTPDDFGTSSMRANNFNSIIISAQELSKNPTRIHGFTVGSSDDFNSSSDSKSSSRMYQENWSPDSSNADLEWDNYDIMTSSLIQSQKYALSEQSIALDVSRKSLSSPPTSKKHLQRTFGMNESQKNPTPSAVRSNRLTSKRGARTPAAFNTTSRPRLSPSDYTSVQKSIEWCNKTYK